MNKQLNQILKQQFKKTKPLQVGDVVSGKVLQKTFKEVIVDLGIYGLGRVYGKEYILGKDLIRPLAVGDEVNVKIISLDDGEGFYEISIQQATDYQRWQKLEEMFRSNQIIPLKVLDANRGGLIVEVLGIKGFVPVSQLAFHHYPRVPENERNKILQHLRSLVGQTLNFRILDLDIRTNKLILSERAADEEKIKKELTRYQIGQILDVEIVGLSKFGIFVRFGQEYPMDGLVHISEVPNGENTNLEEKYQVGQKIKAKLIRIENQRAFFTLKDLEETPLEKFLKIHKEGDVVEGEVKNKDEVLAIVELPGKVKGVVLDNFEDLKIGEKIKFKIKEISPDRQIFLIPEK